MSRILRPPFLVFWLLLAAFGFIPNAAQASEQTTMKVFKSPSCGCCGAWVDHVRAAGFKVEIFDMDDVALVKKHYGIAPDLHSCHTAAIDGYVIEGHVPAADIENLILTRPKARGLAVPGMPAGSPGMEMGDQRDPFDVVLFGDQGRAVFSSYPGQ